MIDAVADRLQFEQAKLRDELIRLSARVAALERETPLPPDRKPEFALTEAPATAQTNTQQPAPQQPVPEAAPIEVELDILSGMGLTAGPRRT